MRRISSLAAAAAVLGYTGLALAQQPAYSPVYPNRYATQPTTGNTMMPERQTMTPSRDTMAPGRQRVAMAAGEVSTDGDARAHCGGDTVGWVNTQSHGYHLAGSQDYRQTDRGALTFPADADG